MLGEIRRTSRAPHQGAAIRVEGAESANFEVSRMARLLEVSRSCNYKWKHEQERTPYTVGELARVDLRAHIALHHTASNGTFRSPRITADLH